MARLVISIGSHCLEGSEGSSQPFEVPQLAAAVVEAVVAAVAIAVAVAVAIAVRTLTGSALSSLTTIKLPAFTESRLAIQQALADSVCMHAAFYLRYERISSLGQIPLRTRYAGLPAFHRSLSGVQSLSLVYTRSWFSLQVPI